MPTQSFKVGEMLNKRTRNSKTWMNFNGSYTTEIHMSDVHFDDENGNLQNINTDLRDEADFDSWDLPVNKYGVDAFEIVREKVTNEKALNKMNRDNFDYQGLQVPFEAILPRNFKRGYTIGSGADKLTFTPVGASPAQGYTGNEKNVLDYQDAWNDAGVSLELTDRGIKETIVLKTSKAPSTFSFEVKGNLADDLTAGELKLMPAWLRDAEGTERDVSQVVRRENNKTYVDLTADVSNLVYPIEIDPTVVIQPDGTSGKDSYVDSGNPSVNYGSDTSLNIGSTFNSATRKMSLLAFDVSSISGYVEISTLTLEQYTRSGSPYVTPYPILSAWEESTVTYSNMPNYDTNNPETKQYIDGSTVFDFDVTSMTAKWVDGSLINNGLVLMADNSSAYVYFYSSNHSASSVHPKLTITYNEPPTAPTVTSPNGGETWNSLHTVTWNASTDNDSANLQYQIQLSTDNGATWKNIVALTSANVTSYTYDFINEAESSTALIRIRAYDGTSYGNWDESDGVFTIQHNVAPNAPTNLSPSGGAPIDRALTNRLSWLHNDPNSGDSQSRFDLQWRLQGGATWNTVTQVTVNNYWDAPANTFPYGDIEWRVRTYDQAGLSSSYSAVEVFLAGDKPSAPTITSPTNASTVSVANPTVQWSSSGQAGYLLRVLDSASTEVYSFSGGTNKAHTVQYDLANQTDYKIELSITNSDGLTSDVDIVAITVSYTPPAKAVIQAINSGSEITIDITNVTPVNTQPTVSYNNLYRREQGGEWSRIAKELPPNTDYTDYTPASNQTYEYYVRAWGDNGTYSDSEIIQSSVTVERPQLALVSDYTEWVKMEYMTDTSQLSGVERSVMQFAGRKEPVSFFGEANEWGVELSMLIKGNENMAKLRKLANSREMLLFRDERGRKAFVTLNGVQETDLPSDYYRVPLNLMRTSYSEVV